MLLLAEMPSEILWKNFELSDSENMHLKCVTILDAYISESKRVLRQKKFVRYKEGAEMYSMSMRKFQDMAKDAGAIYKVGKMALVNCELFEMYLETFRI